MPHVSIRLVLAVLLSALALTAYAAAELNIYLDRTLIQRHEIVQLTIDYSGDRPLEELDLSVLAADFDIVSRSNSQQFSVVNGRSTRRTQLFLGLQPKRTGTLNIPAMTLGDLQSKALKLTVEATSNSSNDPNIPIILENEVDEENPLVQSQVTYTVRLLHNAQFSEGTLTDPQVENTLVERLGEDLSFQSKRDGRVYQVIERRYALFPQSSGPLTIAAPQFSGEVLIPNQPGERYYGRPAFRVLNDFRPVRLEGKTIELNVDIRPAGATDPWLPAQALNINEEWPSSAQSIQVGTPITRTITLEARGLTASQLPELMIAATDGLRIYPEQSQTSNSSQSIHIIGKRIQKMAIVPNRAGRITLPEIRIPWWDVVTQEPRYAVLPAREINVLPAPGQQPSQKAEAVTPSIPDTATAQAELQNGEYASEQNTWQWISAALAIAWLATLLLWFFKNRTAHSNSDPATETNEQVATIATTAELEAACRSNDADTIAKALLNWSARHWPHSPPRSLGKLAERWQDEPAKAALTTLEQARFQGDGTVDGAAIWQAIRTALHTRHTTHSAPDALPPLYPQG